MTSRRSQWIPSKEEIYAMLKECSRDPNETTQKLLLQGIVFFFFLLLTFPFWFSNWLLVGAAYMGLILVIHVLLLVFSLLGFVAFGLLVKGLIWFFFFFFHWGFVMWEMGIFLVFVMMGFHCWCTFCKVKLEMPISCLCYCLLSNSEREAFLKKNLPNILYYLGKKFSFPEKD